MRPWTWLAAGDGTINLTSSIILFRPTRLFSMAVRLAAAAANPTTYTLVRNGVDVPGASFVVLAGLSSVSIVFPVVNALPQDQLAVRVNVAAGQGIVHWVGINAG
jgi:hypothetical protein